MTRFFDHSKYHRTGGQAARTEAWFRCYSGNLDRDTMTDRVLFECGGPIDAPTNMPAGSCTSTDYLDHPSNTTYSRELQS